MLRRTLARRSRALTSKNPAAVALGRLGGLAAAGKGARVLAERMTAKERSESARKAARARWSKKRPRTKETSG